MGTLGGHLLPGFFFICISVWWSFITSIRFVLSKPKRGSTTGSYTYRTSATMPCICLQSSRLRRAPIESLVKVLFASVGILGEIVTGMHFNYVKPINKDDASLFGCDSDGAQMNTSQHGHGHGHHENMASGKPIPFFFEYANAQHITMYTVFAIGAFVELAMHGRKNVVPPQLDMACGLIAFGVEAFLFGFHLHSRAPLDIRIHVLLVFAIGSCALFCALEMMWPRQVLLTYGRVLFTCLQGTWFWQAGFILYPPVASPFLAWDRCNHEQIMTVTLLFCWHLILILIALIAQLCYISYIYRKSSHIKACWNELAEIDSENQSYQDEFGGSEKILYLRSPNLDDDEIEDLNAEKNEKMTLDELI